MLVQCVGGGTCAKGGESAQGGRVALKRDMSICKEHHHAVAMEAVGFVVVFPIHRKTTTPAWSTSLRVTVGAGSIQTEGAFAIGPPNSLIISKLLPRRSSAVNEWASGAFENHDRVLRAVVNISEAIG